ncbi:MAG: transcriptional repressor LexA [Spirochaetales bacterium]|jgi:repressor LexA|nr:transcriptional repressor LexA [Spirochaetales bacterium]
MKTLTKRQAEVLDFIKDYRNKNSYPPTIREIAEFFSISVKGAYDHLKALEKKESIKCNLRRSRAIEVAENFDVDEVINVPLLGNVAAGVPLLSEENLDGYIPVPVRYLKKGQHFALKVKGDSMKDAGILEGDTALIVHQVTAENGNIVVALLNDEAVTLKRFYRETNRIKLKAENPVYPPIYTQNVRILGKLVCLVRNYD